MARSLQVIEQEIEDRKNADPILSQISSPSATALWKITRDVVAFAIYTMEVFWDWTRKDLEEVAAKAPAGNLLWLQDQFFRFQYSSTNPQSIQLIDWAPAYPVIDPELRIITACSVRQDANRIINAKVAKGTAPNLTPLTFNELQALKQYINQVKFAGTDIRIVSEQADRVKIEADIYYDGQYSDVIQASVVSAIEVFLATFTQERFDGVLLLSKLTDAIQAVPGVADVVLHHVYQRRAVQPVEELTPVVRYYVPYAGYVRPEDTEGHALTETLTFIANM